MTSPTDRRTVLVKVLRDPMWQMAGVVVTVLIAVVTAVAAAGGDGEPRPPAPAVSASTGPVPADVRAEVTGACNAVGNGNTVSC